MVEYSKSRFTISDYYDLKKQNKEAFSDFFNDDHNRLKKLFELNLKYCLPFIKIDDDVSLDENPRERIILNCNNATFYLFDSIIELLPTGNYVPIRTIQRQIFEFIIVSSHLVLNNDKKFIDNWLDHKDVKIVKNILKRIKHPDCNPMIQFWVRLSTINHASDITSQYDLDWTYNLGYIIENVTMTYILLNIYNIHLKYRLFPFLKEFAFHSFKIKTSDPYNSDNFANLEMFVNKKKQTYIDLLESFSYNWTI